MGLYGAYSGFGGGQVAAPETGLYAFTAHTFTTGGQTGQTGGDLNDFTTAYAALTWAQDTAYFNVATDGFQRWTVPDTASYDFIVAGSQGGGGGGYGAIVTFTLALIEHDNDFANSDQGDGAYDITVDFDTTITLDYTLVPTGYTHDVIGVDSSNLSKVIGIATANISKVIGV